ncbi:Uncharacterised protein [Mycolicibacterium vanbaalenii]|uniref:Uncharacterized protein n=1 Tax=Mycolicibacterium vanbaalenii TaxID=110539 RepID=A0A5S9MMY8_MYCVN|nr:hypothetical protein [Mycolicibacterium vanbaalenii]CAA0078285.1 Uncharacterised protein [Mycolicibacterium vanbaalenii]
MREHLAPPDSGEPAKPRVCKNCGATMLPSGGHTLRTLDANHRAVPR